ncbi:phosphate ABC transporter substrate-binding protein [Gloeocapsa sp. PCC 73106]|uniref:phosphate ABC transporter substrate-binding protein n=1 Tax=Gloeocapsa sp. PCC 73106 TaxID=102232 RepID=UPI0002ABB680|nr:phosphate ABC transporter substrate-binding protein [Gloeocapsa sp. PCC 73106]ELR99085.1 ABC-type phosphate transport system, periplasmic component [Gloeocapsa sp. PCC 73106]
MAQKNDTLLLLLALVITGAVIGGGLWWFLGRSQTPISTPVPSSEQPQEETKERSLPSTPTTTGAISEEQFPLLTEVPTGTTVRINGATSMVQINEGIKNGFMQQFPGTQVIANASGSEKGISDLLTQKIDLAAISRPLTPAEVQQGLVAIPVTQDAIAVFVGTVNPFTDGLTQAQVAGIFQGQIQNWSEVGGNNQSIRVINRAITSGTHQFFQEVALQGQLFGNTPNITTLQLDETTPLINSVGTDGISYATYSQVANQSKARVVPIDGLNPQDSGYPYQRILFYVYKQPASFNVKAFLGYVKSPQGQQKL